MEDEARALDAARHLRGVSDVALNELHLRREVLRVAGAEVVEHDDVEALAQEVACEVRADEASSAGDEDAVHEGRWMRGAGRR